MASYAIATKAVRTPSNRGHLILRSGEAFVNAIKTVFHGIKPPIDRIESAIHIRELLLNESNHVLGVRATTAELRGI